jgi:hypothetical protein
MKLISNKVVKYTEIDVTGFALVEQLCFEW